MKYRFSNAENISEAISILAPELGIIISDSEADVFVTVERTEENTLYVSIDGKNANITYGGGVARFNRGLAMLVKWVNDGVTAKTVQESPIFTMNGPMIDCSRNAVMNLKTIKFMMRKMALMGLNTMMLYTEDTYELEERPYFGYMRGRYTKNELSELDAYALKLGIELIPCIQVLGHLATAIRWEAMGKVTDTRNALLVGEPETYKLINEMFKTVSECFTTKRIHIGMDETHDLGTGKYIDKFGYRKRKEIYFEHLGKVVEIARSYGFKPMMWSDMFFRMSADGIENFVDYDMRVVLPDNISESVPKGVQQVFWDYYNPSEEFYSVNIEKHKMLGDDTVFAGGIWFWSGHCPLFSRSLRNTIPALDACRKHGVKEVLATVWHNGSSSCLILSLAGLAWYADYEYKGYYCEESIKECFKAACGLDYEDFLKTELPEYPHGGDIGISQTLIYNDPLIGLIDKHIEGVETQEYYKNVSKTLNGIGGGEFSYAFDVIRDFSSLLENKADFGLRLKKAYDENDSETLTAISNECDAVIEKLYAMRKSHRTAWMRYNKPFGWEVHDIRYGGLIMRFETAKERIKAYLAGDIECIDELSEKRLRFDCLEESAPLNEGFLWPRYTSISTTGIL